MSSGDQNGFAIEVFEVLPRCLASLNDGVWPLLPAVRMGCWFNVDTVEYWFYCGSYSVEVVFSGLWLPVLAHLIVPWFYGGNLQKLEWFVIP